MDGKRAGRLQMIIANVFLLLERCWNVLSSNIQPKRDSLLGWILLVGQKEVRQRNCLKTRKLMRHVFLLLLLHLPILSEPSLGQNEQLQKHFLSVKSTIEAC